ncbi:MULTISPECIES: cytochrome c biogenesis CcdA family protein [Actinomadura]|uniref:Cytochrome c-type biogenesis protein n=1 Tax=Actinomadura madurae TaxID=1993 RepID=A0A1I5EHQ3_9ACTN|nr:cytochrome c biogenesis protein CcdA [Actinomadura madurae]URM98339.1 cytochrome C biogenesis protein CcdA [Actinomadura madurae]URN09031.1 cytochrome C biogenesis protein CcdA [Actinomadura madurae]SFO11017.1 cytochrome c-type biogenesis protein [Actinomadura madurae]
MSSLGETVVSGSLVAAAPLAALAGLVSFASPCVLPLVPGYLSYVTGMTGVDLAEQRRGRLLAGVLLFVAGFSAVFVSYGVIFGGLGRWLLEYQDPITRVLGAVTIVFGLAFMGLVPGLQRTMKSGRLPAAGLAGAPLLGVLFGLGWTPCIGPTLGAVQGLAITEASAGRGALLSLAYCAGLGLPFVVTALAYRRALGAFGAVKRHYPLVMRTGGGMLVLIGVLLVSGLWGDLTIELRSWISGFEPVI